MPLELFHPAVSSWFEQTFQGPTQCQLLAWPAIKNNKHTLIAAPTGSGKTLAAFLASIDDLVRKGEKMPLADETHIVYISPLKALSNDIHRNLDQPLEGIRLKLFELGYEDVCIRAFVRTGDTPASTRAAMARKPPHIIVTTPESFYILLTSDSGRRMLKTVSTVIVDEIHAVVGNKRGSHLALSLERLELLTGPKLNRIGLSATQRPLDEVGRYLVGDFKNREACETIDIGHRRNLDIGIVVPSSPLEALLSAQLASELYDMLTTLIRTHKTTLIFVNTRRMAERVARYLSERIGEENVTSHHGSLAREQRLSAESRLKEGKLCALVATASLELGIDIGDIDLVCQIGTTRSISTLMQRVGRSGHRLNSLPKGRLFPTSRDELIECIALVEAVQRHELDLLNIPLKSKDVLAQQIVAMVACEDWKEDALYECIRHAYPYQTLSKHEFSEIIEMLANGFNTQKGRRSAYLHRDIINKQLTARRGARLTAVTCGGAIPDNADYRVILEPTAEYIGTVDEDFAMESLRGDIFQLGNSSWRVLGLENGELKVEDAQNLPPSIPFWFGEAPGRTWALSKAVSRIRGEIAERCNTQNVDDKSAVQWLQKQFGLESIVAIQAVNYIALAKTTLGVIPNFDDLVLERFFDESGGMHLILHAPFGNRINRAWGLALRKRFCRTFNFELQAAATENAVLLSMGTSQSFPLEDVAHFLSPKTVKDILIQALLDAPMFTIRWRWNAVCSLALKRFYNGKKTPPYLLRMQSEDLITSVFPDQMACLENIAGDRAIPDHPLVAQTLKDCISEAMDIEGLIRILQRLDIGTLKIKACDLVEPSPMAAEILTANNYAFLDGAPAEERRTRAVVNRRWLDPHDASDLGRLDSNAIALVRVEAWPDATNVEELSDTLCTLGFIDAESETTSQWQPLFEQLVNLRRATCLTLCQTTRPNQSTNIGNRVLWISAERLALFQAIYPESEFCPILTLPQELTRLTWNRDTALTEIIRARLAACGPVHARALADKMALDKELIDQILIALENDGYVLRGHFTSNTGETEWCERNLLARIHKYTIKSLRQQIEPVPTSDFFRMLIRWQRLGSNDLMEGAQALIAIVEQMEGFETAASAWESEIFRYRLKNYEPYWLDNLCQSGKIVWARLTPGKHGRNPIKSSPLAFFPRKHWQSWCKTQPSNPLADLTVTAESVLDILSRHGALFFDEIQDQCRILKTHLENTLAELVTKGLISCDSFSGIRAMLVSEHKKRGHYKPLFEVEESGRWSLLKKNRDKDTLGEQNNPEHRLNSLEHIAKVLLKRYGIVFRALLTRESLAPSWGDLLQVYRRLEDRGEVRGGRFVSGQYGEQFALTEAIELLRKTSKQPIDEFLIINACDPLNLVGIIMPGTRLAALSGNKILFENGVPIATQTGKQIHYLKKLNKNQEWAIKQRLVRRIEPLVKQSINENLVP